MKAYRHVPKDLTKVIDGSFVWNAKTVFQLIRRMEIYLNKFKIFTQYNCAVFRKFVIRAKLEYGNANINHEKHTIAFSPQPSNNQATSVQLNLCRSRIYGVA